MNTPTPPDYRRVSWPEPHRARTKRLLGAHPEAKALCGHAPSSALYVIGLVALQIGIALLLRGRPLWLVFLVAYTIGAVANHALWVLIHECAHNLVFRGASANAGIAILANLPIVFPSAIAFRKYHLLHHAYQGQEDLDADLASPAEARLVGSSAWRKALWLLFFFAAQALRVGRLKRVRLVDGWYLTNAAVEVSFLVGLGLVGGPKALAYLFLASVFSIGLHPLGARWIQEHYLTFPGDQETFSYYGPMNRFAFNVGFHNEHHDLMRVPWSRLPDLRRMAPELYETLESHSSWTKLLLRFIFDPSLSLHSRAVRSEAVDLESREAAASS
ncbi:MAG TPA: fatty acid desaturase [Anaeromyxobacteraceae bacterium]|nr:fatty acid desaturase [Anaeromyxobacteraceae bacterium]